MQLSVIIVNYNVRYFLEQCLRAVLNAVEGMNAEIIVVDNHSADGSMEYLQPLFPGVRFMVSNKNRGFAKANNRALAVARGEYILFLNPDTLIPEDSLYKCVSYLQQNPQAGALGVRMLDGRGRFLPESKRSFPAPLVSLYKLTGLAALFPKSSVFNKYALGHLDEHKNHVVEVLCGAFMMVRKELLVQLKGFDEDYFLYGEDIDLSFRIQQSGFENHYFAGTSIIHFKGESSGNHELGRVKFFYNAMQIFVKKHYQNGTGKILSVFLRMAIAARAAISACGKLLKPVLLPLADGIAVWLSLQIVRMAWVRFLRDGKGFGVPFIPYALVGFSVLFVLCSAFTGLYDKRYKTSQTIVSIGFGVISMLAVYSLLPEGLRFSRGVIVWGGILAGAFIFLSRKKLLKNKNNGLLTEEETEGQTIVVATEKEYAEVKQLLENVMLDQQLLGRVSAGDADQTALCHLEELTVLEKNIPISRIIFCVGELSLARIITQIQMFAGRKPQFLFHISGSGSIVGSHTLTPGADIVGPFVDYRITHPYQQRMKRVADLFLSLILLPTIPFHPRKPGLARNIYQVLRGNKTWVGYTSGKATLPPLKKSVISSTGNKKGFSEGVLEKADSLYAKNYDWWQDPGIVWKNYRRLG